MAFAMIQTCAWTQDRIRILELVNSNPVPGAMATVGNDKKLYIADANGEINVPTITRADTIRVKAVGFEDATVPYGLLFKRSYRIYLTEKVNALQETVVSASKFEEKKEDVSQTIKVIKASDMQNMNQATTADVLQQSGEVLVQKSQLGGGSPIIRGFETNKVLIVVDGVRMNNAIYRGGHLQNVITLDNAILERTEIVFGPGSVIYGSDALGGVMHFHTRNPELATGDKSFTAKANAYARYATAARERSWHADASYGNKKIAGLTSFTMTDLRDLRQGNLRNPFYENLGARNWYVERIDGVDSLVVNYDPNIQVGSGYKQYDVLQKVLYKPGENASHMLNFQFSTSTNINRYDRLTQTAGGLPRFGEWYYGPQNRLLASYTWDQKFTKGIADNLRVIAAFQNIDESRHDRRYKKDDLNHRVENVKVITLNADAAKQIKHHEMRYGLEGTYNLVTSTAELENIATGEISPLDTRYPDGGSSMYSAAAYVTHTFEAGEKFTFSEGIRFSHVGLDATFNDTTFYQFPFSQVSQRNSGVTGSLGVIWRPVKSIRVHSHLSSGFRAPNVDDLSKVFETAPGLVVVPNPDLKTEKTYNADLGFTYRLGQILSAGITGFYTDYEDAIGVQSGTWNGSDSIEYDGTLSKVIMNVNNTRAFIYGCSGELLADINPNFSVRSTFTWTYGRIVTESGHTPLDHIPPAYGRTSFILKARSFRGEFYVMYNGWKRLKDYRLGAEDNEAFATSLGMPAWCTLNVRATVQLRRYVSLQMALENIMDQNYRVFASNISAPGRNFSITLRLAM
jgi:hemoglobin/transferrin/lactoferrin receptor protein